MVLDQQQHPDTPVHYRMVLGHLARGKRERDVAEDPDLGAKNPFVKGTGLRPRDPLHSLDKAIKIQSLHGTCCRVERGLRERSDTNVDQSGGLPGFQSRLANCLWMMALNSAEIVVVVHR